VCACETGILQEQKLGCESAKYSRATRRDLRRGKFNDQSLVGLCSSKGFVTRGMVMLNSCAGGGTVVNINTGFGASYAASLINQLAHS
jgi:hypothetical protein